MRVEVPLAIWSAGTVVSLFFSKKYHIWLGAGCSLLAAAHVFHYRKSLRHDFQKEWERLKIFQALHIPTTKTEWLLQQVTVSSYLPGRIRLHAKKLLHNEPLRQELARQFASIPELHEVSFNTMTGSILIIYDPAILRQNPEMADFERRIAARYKK